MLWPLLLLLINFSSAQTTEENLRSYIQMLNFRPLPEMKPKNEALYQLGLRLFYEKSLSGKGNISCNDCHSLGGYSSDTLILGVGEGAQGLSMGRQQAQGVLLARHTPNIYNAGYPDVTSLFWDGRIRNHPKGGWWTPEEKLNGPNPEYKEIAETLDSLLAAQSLFPMASPEEMLGQGETLPRIDAWNNALDRVFNGRLGASYKRFFREAFPGVEKYNIGHAANAIAEFERHHFLANDTPWDRYLKNNKEILTERMKRGAILFLDKGRCSNCHRGEHLSDFDFKAIGIPQIGPGVKDGDDKGQSEFTGVSTQNYLFRTPALRNVALTRPYMHSGAFSTMWEVIDHYKHPAVTFRNFNWDPKQPRYREDLKLDESVERSMARSRALSHGLPRMIDFSLEDKKDLYCFLMVGLTEMKLQKDLILKGVLDEMEDCSPRITH